MQLFLPITKVDAAKRLVYGTLAEEVPDRAGEIFDYASSKPNFARWSAEIAKASDGRSLGNLRAMHGKVAAGKLAALEFDDGGRRIEAVAKVVDEAEWAKVLEGVYTGFSIGGKYAKRWKDPEDPALMRYTADPAEVSLVDNPCIPTATFTMVKADGSEEQRPFKPGGSEDFETDPVAAALAKVGARHSKVDKARLQHAHDLLVALGADCDGVGGEVGEAPDGDDAGTAGKGTFGMLAKLMEEKDALETTLAELAPQLAALQKRIESLEAQPQPPKGALKSIDKAEDAANGLDKSETSDPTDPLALVKRAHRHPVPLFALGTKP